MEIVAAVTCSKVMAPVQPASVSSTSSASASMLPSPSDLSHDELHAFNHKNAPGALRALYQTLCDDLLDDARMALDEEKRRRSDAS